MLYKQQLIYLLQMMTFQFAICQYELFFGRCHWLNHQGFGKALRVFRRVWVLNFQVQPLVVPKIPKIPKIAIDNSPVIICQCRRRALTLRQKIERRRWQYVNYKDWLTVLCVHSYHEQNWLLSERFFNRQPESDFSRHLSR